MLLLEKIRWRNFLSTGNQWTEIVLNKNATTLVIGKNGAGKSTLLDAITYALFGKPFRKINKPQLHNSITKKNLLVELELQINGVPYLIRRGDRPGIFEVHQNGKLLNQNAKNTEYQETLEKQIIKCNFKSFCQIVILGSATYQPFMGLPAGNRREIIEDLLDLQVFTTMNKLLVQRVNDNNSLIVEKSNAKELANQKIKLISKHLQEVRDLNDKMISEKRDRLDSSKQQLSDLQRAASTLVEEIRTLRSSILDESSVSSKLKKLEHLKVKIVNKISSLNRDIEFFDSHDDCPTCNQSIEKTFKDCTIQSRKTKISETEDGLTQLESEYSKLSTRIEEISKISDSIIEKNLDLSAYNTKITGMIDYIEELESDISKLDEKKIDVVDSSKIEELRLELDSIDRELVELHDQKQIYQVIGALLKDGGIKSKIVKQYIPIINKFINKYLSTMDFFVNFELNESFEETIKSRYRDEFSYASFSEGEKMKINLAILFTWRAIAKLRNSINTNLLIMDEVLDGSIDAEAKDSFFQILSTMTDTNVFVISHAGDALFDKFHSVVKFEKVKNFSRIV